MGSVQHGWAGVKILFVISGFVIGLSAMQTTPKRFAISPMAIRACALSALFWKLVTGTILMGGRLFTHLAMITAFAACLLPARIIAQWIEPLMQKHLRNALSRLPGKEGRWTLRTN